MMAASWEATDCLTLLLARLGDGIAEQLGMVDNDGNSAAHHACRLNHPSILDLLLDAGALMIARDNRGRTPLMVAAVRGATGCVTLLLENGAKADGDRTALHLAAYDGHHQIISLLLHAGTERRHSTKRKNGAIRSALPSSRPPSPKPSAPAPCSRPALSLPPASTSLGRGVRPDSMACLLSRSTGQVWRQRLSTSGREWHG